MAVMAPRISLRRMAEATPGTRDRYVDFLRSFSILVVVLGHWLIAIMLLAAALVAWPRRAGNPRPGPLPPVESSP